MPVLATTRTQPRARARTAQYLANTGLQSLKTDMQGSVRFQSFSLMLCARGFFYSKPLVSSSQVCARCIQTLLHLLHCCAVLVLDFLA